MSERIVIENLDDDTLLAAAHYLKTDEDLRKLVSGAAYVTGLDCFDTLDLTTKQMRFFLTAFHLGLAAGIRDLMNGKLNIVLVQTDSENETEEGEYSE